MSFPFHSSFNTLQSVPVTNNNADNVENVVKREDSESTNSKKRRQSNKSTTEKKKRKQVKRACVNCHKSHAGCDDNRPCKRCVSLGLEASCIDVVPNRQKNNFQASSNTSTNSGNSGKTNSTNIQPVPTVNNNTNINNNGMNGNQNTNSKFNFFPFANSSQHLPQNHLFPPMNNNFQSLPSNMIGGHINSSPSSGFSKSTAVNGTEPSPSNTSNLSPSILNPHSRIISNNNPSTQNNNPYLPRMGMTGNHLLFLEQVLHQQNQLLQALTMMEQQNGGGTEFIPQNNNSNFLPPPSSIVEQNRLPPIRSDPNLSASVSSPFLTNEPLVRTPSLLSPTSPNYHSSFEGLLGPSTPQMSTPIHQTLLDKESNSTTVINHHHNNGSSLHNNNNKPTTTLSEPTRVTTSVKVEKTENSKEKTNDNEDEDVFVGFFKNPSTGGIDIIDDYFTANNSNISGDEFEGELNNNNTSSSNNNLSFLADKTCILPPSKLSNREFCSGSIYIPSGELDTTLCVAVWTLNGILFSANENFFNVFKVPSLSENTQIHFSSILSLDSDTELKQLFSCRTDFYSKPATLHIYSEEKRTTPPPSDQLIEGYLQAYVIRNCHGILPKYISTHISVPH
ncbi:hypothetical protein ABK040_004384 [Willaertia magna]